MFIWKLDSIVEIIKEISNLDISEATQKLDAPIMLIKENYDISAEVLYGNFNKTLETQIFRKVKWAYMKPIYKKDSRINKENLRPASTLSNT